MAHWRQAHDLEQFLLSGADPYANSSPDQWAAISKQMIDLLPLDQHQLVADLRQSYQQLLQTDILGQPLLEMNNGRKIISLLLHELIVKTVAQQSDFTPGGNERCDKDIICDPYPGLSLEVKGSQSKAAIAANKSYVLDNPNEQPGSKSRRSLYLAVNHQPDQGRITRIAMAYLTPDDWQIHDRRGALKKGQIVPLKKSSWPKLCRL